MKKIEINKSKILTVLDFSNTIKQKNENKEKNNFKLLNTKENYDYNFQNKLKSHGYSLNKLENFIFEASVVKRDEFNHVTLDINLNNTLVFKDNFKENLTEEQCYDLPEGFILNKNLTPKSKIKLNIIKLLKRDNEWKEEDFDQIIIEENSIGNFHSNLIYNKYLFNLKIKKTQTLQLKDQKYKKIVLNKVLYNKYIKHLNILKNKNKIYKKACRKANNQLIIANYKNKKRKDNIPKKGKANYSNKNNTSINFKNNYNKNYKANISNTHYTKDANYIANSKKPPIYTKSTNFKNNTFSLNIKNKVK